MNNVDRWFKTLVMFAKYLPSALAEHWKRSRKEVMLLFALGTVKGRHALAEALSNPIGYSLYKGNGKKYKKEKP
jgi:hypothetical protein